MIPVLEAVPNFSEGRDPAVRDALVDAISRHDVEVLDVSMDPDHHRSVVTFVGHPPDVELALVAAAAVALERIDLRDHAGCHPRVGAMDVCPLVPLHGMVMADAVASAQRVGRGIASLGIPVFWYGAAATDPDRTLAGIRRGGFEAMRDGWPADRRPDLDAGRNAAHPTAGVTCVGARTLLLAWNVWVDGLDRTGLAKIADRVRERGGGMAGLRALAFELPRQGGLQLSMNLEGVEARDPFGVFLRIEEEIGDAGGRITQTEVIGMIPDALVFPAAARTLRLIDPDPARVLSGRVSRHVLDRVERETATVVDWILGPASGVPPQVRDAAGLLAGRASPPPIPGEDA